MSAVFLHGRDGRVRVSDGSYTAEMPLAAFQVLETAYVPAAGLVGRLYRPGAGHTEYLAHGATRAGADPWPDGDAMIAQAPYYLGQQTGLHAYLADRRWRKEVAGTTVGGIAIETTDASKTKLLGLKGAAQRKPDETFSFAAENGRVTLTASEAITLVEAVEDFVQATFEAANTIAGEIDAGTITRADEIEEHGAWAF